MKRLFITVFVLGAICALGIGTASDVHANQAPIAAARVSIDGGATWSQSITLTQGVPYTAIVDGTGSTDPDGWTTPNTGVSSGAGYCVMNTGFATNSFAATSTIFTPANPGACKYT